MQGIHEKDCRVGGLARVDIEVNRWNPDSTAEYIECAVEILISIEAPGITHTETLQDLAHVHAYIGEFTGEQVEHREVHVVLLVQSSVVDDNSEDVMSKVAHVEEPIPLHESAVPDKVSSHVTESEYLKFGVLLRA